MEERNLELVATVAYAGKLADVPGFNNLDIVTHNYKSDQAYFIIMSTTIDSKHKGIGIILNDAKSGDHADLEKFLKSARVSYNKEIKSENVADMTGATLRVLANYSKETDTIMPLAVGYVGIDTCFILKGEPVAPRNFKFAKAKLF